MHMDLDEVSLDMTKHALEVYLANLRGEIRRTDNRHYKGRLKHEAKVLKEVMHKLG